MTLFGKLVVHCNNGYLARLLLKKSLVDDSSISVYRTSRGFLIGSVLIYKRT